MDKNKDNYVSAWTADNSELKFTSYNSGMDFEAKKIKSAEKYYPSKNEKIKFTGCQKAITIDVSHLNTKDYTNSRGMFGWCTSLRKLDVSNFDTQNMRDMSRMFNYCPNLEYVDVRGFDTHNVTNMSQMFSHCSLLTGLDVAKFDTGKVTDMSYMFNHCDSLIALKLRNWDTSSVKNMSSMFADCKSLQSLDLGNWNLNNVQSASIFLRNNRSLKELDVTGWKNYQDIIEKTGMFYGCNKDLRITCNPDFRDWAIRNAEEISLPYALRDAKSPLWNIVSYGQGLSTNPEKREAFIKDWIQEAEHTSPSLTLPDGTKMDIIYNPNKDELMLLSRDKGNMVNHTIAVDYDKSLSENFTKLSSTALAEKPSLEDAETQSRGRGK